MTQPARAGERTSAPVSPAPRRTPAEQLPALTCPSLFHPSGVPLQLQDGAGIVEKGDLIAKVKEVAAAGPEGEAPAGYVFDAASGYYISAGWFSVRSCACFEHCAQSACSLLRARRAPGCACTPMPSPPPSFSFFFCNAETGLYWDARTGGFFNSGDGKWYSWDESGQKFVEWAQ